MGGLLDAVADQIFYQRGDNRSADKREENDPHSDLRRRSGLGGGVFSI
jgi:hypothetical protein